VAIYSYQFARGQTRWMFTIDLPPAADGRRRQMNRKGFVSQQAAQAAETEVRKAYARADLAADGSLAAELEVWLGERELDVQQTTLGKSKRTVALGPTAVAVLRAHRRRQDAEKTAAAELYDCTQLSQ
jgi:hypothetical protein